MTLYHCSACPLNNNEDCGPWDENDSEIFKNCKQTHQAHSGWGEFSDNVHSIDDAMDWIPKLFAKAREKTIQRNEQKGSPLEQIEDYLNSIIKNDQNLVKKILWCFFSAYTKNPINLGIMAPTSEGKTYATVKVSELFPKEDVISIGRMSPTALIHQNGTLVDENLVPIEKKIDSLDDTIGSTDDQETRIQAKKDKKELLKTAKNLIDLNGKILLFLDAPNIQLWDVLKPILSHDSIEISFKTTKGDGSLHVKESIIRGWPSVVFCSAKNESQDRIWDEIETRFDITSPNTSIQKYKDANSYTSMKMGIPSFASTLVKNDNDENYSKLHVKKIKEQLCKFDMENPVFNPFHETIANSFPSADGGSMRHFNRFTSYCNLSTMINAGQKYRIIFESLNGYEYTYLISDISDIENAIDLVGSLSAIPPNLINFVNDIFVPTAEGVIAEGVTTQQLAEKYQSVYGKDTTAKKILENFVKPLKNYGIVNFKDNPDDKRQHLNFLVSDINGNNLQIIRDSVIEQSNNDDLFVWKYILDLEKCSIEKGQIKTILDSSGHAEGHNLIQKNITKVHSKSKVLETDCA